MIKRVETNLYKSEAIKEDINNAVGIAESADATAGTALSRATYEYGVCTDSSDTQNKVVVIENFPELYVGATCTVTFRNRNTAQSPTLNVNGTGAKIIYARGSGLSARSGYNWENGAVLRFIYDGTYWVMMPQSMQEAVNVLAGSNENSQTQIMYVEQGRVYINADYITTGSLDASIIATTELNAANITVGKIQGTQIEADAIKAEHLATDSVTADAIKANSIGASEIIAGSITGTEIASNSIESKHIVANSIEASDIAANAITTAKIAADAITADKIATDAVTADAIKANSVGTDELKANSVTATEIASNTITANEIAANAITASELSANSVTSVKIATGAVTADKIQAGAVTADKIQAGAITTEKLGAIEISGNVIKGGEISGVKIKSESTSVGTTTITGGKLTQEYGSQVVTIGNGTVNVGWGSLMKASVAYDALMVKDGSHTTKITTDRISMSSGSDFTVGGNDITPWANSGDYLYFYSGPFMGALSENKKTVYVYLPSHKSLAGRSASTVSIIGSLYIRTTEGKVLGGGSLSSFSTMKATVYEHGITVELTASSALSNCKGNEPVSVSGTSGSNGIRVLLS